LDEVLLMAGPYQACETFADTYAREGEYPRSRGADRVGWRSGVADHGLSPLARRRLWLFFRCYISHWGLSCSRGGDAFYSAARFATGRSLDAAGQLVALRNDLIVHCVSGDNQLVIRLAGVMHSLTHLACHSPLGTDGQRDERLTPMR
jgi:hypothetical protein